MAFASTAELNGLVPPLCTACALGRRWPISLLESRRTCIVPLHHRRTLRLRSRSSAGDAIVRPRRPPHCREPRGRLDEALLPDLVDRDAEERSVVPNPSPGLADNRLAIAGRY